MLQLTPDHFLIAIEALKRQYQLDLNKAHNCIRNPNQKIVDKKAEAFAGFIIKELDNYLEQQEHLDNTYIERQDPCNYCIHLTPIGDDDETFEDYDMICAKSHDLSDGKNEIDRSKTGCHDYEPEEDAEAKIAYEISRKKEFWQMFDKKEFKLMAVDVLFNKIKDKIKGQEEE